MDWIGKYNLTKTVTGLVSRAAVCVLILAVSSYAATAVLECTRDSSPAGNGKAQKLPLKAVYLYFRFSVIPNWSVAKAQLLLHLAEGEAPRKLAIGLTRREWSESLPVSSEKGLKLLEHAVHAEQDGWIRIEVQAALVEILAASKAKGLVIAGADERSRNVHARESGQYAPYLIVDGRPR